MSKKLLRDNKIEEQKRLKEIKEIEHTTFKP